MATIWEATFDYDDSDGDNLTDASLSSFSGNVLGGGAASIATFNEAFSFEGQFCSKWTPTTGNDRFVSVPFTSQDELWYRFYIYIEGTPAGTCKIFRARASPTQTSANLFFTSTGQFRVGTNTNDNVYTTTNGYLNQWVRVEWRVSSPPSGTGSQRLRIYAGANLNSSTTVSEQSTDVAVSTYASGLISNQFGAVVDPLAAATYYIDEIVASDSGWVGPIAVLPQASFTASTETPTVGQTVTFTNTSVDATSYSWNFDDGTAESSSTNPTHAFTSSGVYNVILTAINANGIDQYTLVLTVGTPTSSSTLFDLSYESGTVGAEVVEAGYPVVADTGGTLKYVDTNVVKGSRAVELDNTVGPVWMSYSFSSAQQHVWFRQYITVTKIPNTNAMVLASARTGAGAVISNLVLDQHGKWSLWRGTGGLLGALSTESESASSPGILTRVEWRLNCATATQTIRVFVGSNAHGTTPDITTYGSLPNGVTVGHIMWGNTHTSNAKYTFDGTAVGTVDWIGAISSPNAYSGAPTAGFIAQALTIGKGDSVQLTNRSLGSPDSYSWNFGDGTGTGTSPNHTFSNGGTFTVTLTATNASGTSPSTQLVVTALDTERGQAVPKVRDGGVWKAGAATGGLVKIRQSGAWSQQARFRVYKDGLWSSNLALDSGQPDPGTGTGWGNGTNNLTTWYGSSLGWSNYSGNLNNFGALDATRVFSPGSPNNWDWANVPSDARAGMGTTSYLSWYSFKLSKDQWDTLLAQNGKTTAQRTTLRNQIRSFCDSIPTNYRVLLTCHHEPENDTDKASTAYSGNPTQWRQIQREIQAQVTAAREARTTNKNWLKYASVLMGFTFTSSNRNPEDWRVDELDMWGYDAYNLGPQRESAQYAIDHGKAWGYGEVGNRSNGTDSGMYSILLDGAQMWTTRATKPKVVTYWQQVSNSGSCWEIVLWPTSIPTSTWNPGSNCPAIPARPLTLGLWRNLCQTGRING